MWPELLLAPIVIRLHACVLILENAKSIKEADSSVNGVVAYFILLSGAALQHPPPAKRRCNLSGEINIKCMCKAMTYVGLGIAHLSTW